MTIPEQVQNDILMHKKVKITVLRTEYYQELAKQYAIPIWGSVLFIRKVKCCTAMASIHRMECVALLGR